MIEVDEKEEIIFGQNSVEIKPWTYTERKNFLAIKTVELIREYFPNTADLEVDQENKKNKTLTAEQTAIYKKIDDKIIDACITKNKSARKSLENLQRVILFLISLESKDKIKDLTTLGDWIWDSENQDEEDLKDEEGEKRILRYNNLDGEELVLQIGSGNFKD